MRLGHSRPPGIVRFGQNASGSSSSTTAPGQQVEECSPLPPTTGAYSSHPGKHGNAGRAHRLLNHFFVARQPLADQPRVDGRQRLFFHRSFGQRKQHDLFCSRRRALRAGIELADGLDLVAEQLDAHRPVEFRRIDIEQAAAMRELARHLDHVHLVVADDAQVLYQPLRIEHLAAAHHLCQIGVEAGIAQTHRRCGDRRDDDAGGPGGDLPQSGGAGFLDFGMWR